MIQDAAVEAAFRSMYGPNPSDPSDAGDAHLLKELRQALEAAAQHMLTPRAYSLEDVAAEFGIDLCELRKEEGAK